MRLSQKLSHFRLALVLGATTGLSAGCIVTLNGAGSDECGGVGSHSEMVGDDCVCDPGYEWCNPDVQDDYSCCEYQEPCSSGANNHLNEEDACVCDAGFTWCDPDDVDNLDCCPITDDSGTSGNDGTDGTDGGDGDGGTTGTGGELPPETCSEDEEGLNWCTHTTDMGPAGSQTFTCEAGFWVENTTFIDEWCASEDADFGVGCVWDMENGYQVVCGNGPGDDCDEGTYEANCFDDDTLYTCNYAKVHSTGCLEFCNNGSMNGLGQDFEMGMCEVVEGVADCSCFDP